MNAHRITASTEHLFYQAAELYAQTYFCKQPTEQGLLQAFNKLKSLFQSSLFFIAAFENAHHLEGFATGLSLGEASRIGQVPQKLEKILLDKHFKKYETNAFLVINSAVGKRSRKDAQQTLTKEIATHVMKRQYNNLIVTDQREQHTQHFMREAYKLAIEDCDAQIEWNDNNYTHALMFYGRIK